MQPPYDPRAIANLLLELAEQEGLRFSNLSLQKVLYFAHAIFLIETGRPLLGGFFEAWKFGPVHPTVYQSFKSAGGKSIDFRATREDVVTGLKHPILLPTDSNIVRYLRKIIIQYGHMTPGRLIDISHAPNAPWDYIVKKAKSSVALSMRIPDSVTIERFKYHKISVPLVPRLGEPDEDSPLA